ncbi:MAG: HIRAN domain-containing protein [Eubacterium sp.]|nr:HIRAN domain-containing protein [Eubacterium sp.]
MANELSPGQDFRLVEIIEHNKPGELIKPLIREIHLFDTFVAGTTHLKDQSVLDQIKVKDKLILKREDNRFDENAILVLTESGIKLGYIPEKDNIVFSRLMDAGKLLVAKINDIKKRGTFTQISIGIYLIDF